MKKGFSIIALSLALGAGGVAAQQEGEFTAFVKVGHLAPFADTISGTEVTIEFDGNDLIGAPVAFKQFGGPLSFGDITDPFDVDVDVFAPPGATSPAISETLSLADGTEYTVVAIGNITNQPLELLTLIDNQFDILGGEPSALLRIVHAAPFATDLADTEVDIRTDGGSVVNNLTGVPYKGESGFFPLPPGTYDLKVTTPGGGTTLIDLAPVTLNGGDEVTVFAVGDIVNQPVGAVALFDDGTAVELPLEEPLGDIRSVPTLGWLGIALMALLLGGIGVRRMI